MKDNLIAWLRLARISLLPSAIANILASYLIANGSWQPLVPLLLLMLSSCCLYTGGMVLNDVFDFETDRNQRPGRPLPSGAISRAAARNGAVILLGTGIGLAALSGWSQINGGAEQGSTFDFRPLVISVLLATAIVLYDGVLKKTIFACPLMGSCRALNILLGASTSISASPGFLPVTWCYALAILVYICGVTWFARRETEKVAPSVLIPPAVMIAAGFFIYALVSRTDSRFSLSVVNVFPILMLFLAGPVMRRIIVATRSGDPADVRAGVISSLKSLVILDAALCVLVPGGFVYAFAVLFLIIPSFLLSRAIPPT